MGLGRTGTFQPGVENDQKNPCIHDAQVNFSAVQVLGLFLFSALLIFYNLGGGSLWDWDEAIYASVAKGIDQSGEWLSLYLNGHYWPEKAPLVIWAMALCFKLLGVNEFAARLPSAIFGLLSIGLVYVIGRRLFNHRIGLLSAFFLLATMHFLILSRTAMLDVPMAFFMTAGMYWFWLGREQPRGYWLAGAAIGLAVMSKGLIGFLPLPIIFFYLVLSGQCRLFKSGHFWMMVLLGPVIAAPWHLHQILTHGMRFIDSYVAYHSVRRLTAVIENHGGTVFFYAKYVLEHFFSPWLLLAALVMGWFGWQWIKRLAGDRLNPFFFIAWWLIAVTLFFSLARTKVAGYILPAYVPLALLTAKLCLDHLHQHGFALLFYACLALTGVHLALVHPLNLVLVDKSPAVKELAASLPGDPRLVIVYRHPANAAAFYFGGPIQLAETPAHVRIFQSQDKNAILFCRQADLADFSAKGQEREWKIFKVSQSAEWVLAHTP